MSTTVATVAEQRISELCSTVQLCSPFQWILNRYYLPQALSELPLILFSSYCPAPFHQIHLSNITTIIIFPMSEQCRKSGKFRAPGNPPTNTPMGRLLHPSIPTSIQSDPPMAAWLRADLSIKLILCSVARDAESMAKDFVGWPEEE